MFKNNFPDEYLYKLERDFIKQQLKEDKNTMLSSLKFDESVREKIDDLFDIDLDLACLGKEHVFFSKAIFKINHAVLTFKKIKRIQNIFLEENTKKCYKLIWSRPYTKDHWNPLSKMKGARQICGNIKIYHNNILIVETRGKSLMIDLIFILKDVLGENIELIKLKLQNAMDLLKKL